MKKLFTIITVFFTGSGIAQNVGIGTPIPADKLTVLTSTNAYGFTHTNGPITIGSYISSVAGWLGTKTLHPLYFFTGNSGSLATLSTSGNFGIGTITPGARLEVNGQVKITGGTLAAGNLLESDATGLATWVDKSASFLPAGVSGNTLRHTGAGWIANSLLFNNGTNIGIGTAAPGYILDINGRARLRHNGITSGMWYNKADNTEAAFVGMFNDSIYGYYGTNFWQIGMDVKNGMLGIGNLAPKAPLSFSNTIGNKIALWGDPAVGHYGIGIQGSLLQLYTSDINADVVFGYGKSSGFNETMRIKGNGKVGIGGVSPTNYQLHVLGWPNDKLLQLENTDILDAGINNSIMFQTGGQYTAAVKTIGESTNAASLVFYTGTSGAETGLTRRMTIANSGNIGIGTFVPTSLFHVENLTGTTEDRLLSYFYNRNGLNGPYSSAEFGNYKAGAVSQTTGVRGDASGAVINRGITGFAQATNGQTAYGVYGGIFQINGGTAYAGYFQGNLAYTGSLINASDATLKTNIQPLENALTSLNKIQIKQYQFTDESNKILNTTPGLHIGVLAQQLQEVFPTLVTKQVQPVQEKRKDKNGVEKIEQTGTKEYLGVNYTELIPVLIKGMQEQQVMIEELKKKIEVLEKR